MTAEDEIQTQYRLLDLYRRRLTYSLGQRIKMGSTTPFNIIEEIREARVEISRIRQRLRQLGMVVADQSEEYEEGANSSPVDQKQASSILNYVIFGIEDENMLPWFELFANYTPSNYINLDQSEITEVYFDDADEMASIFTSLNNIAERAQVLSQSTNKEDALEKAWKEEAITRMSKMIFSGTTMKSPGMSSGIKYIVLGVRNDYASLIHLLRGRHLLGQERVEMRNAKEVRSNDVNVLPQIPELLNRAIAEAAGDNEKFSRILFETVMRIRSGVTK